MFDDDNFWVKLDRDNDDIEFMNNNPTYNGAKYCKKVSTQSKLTKEPQTNRAIAVTCNVKDDTSHFDKTKLGKFLLALTFILSTFVYAFILITIILAIRGMMFIPFAICAGGFFMAFAIVCSVRIVLNRKYKIILAEKEKSKQKLKAKISKK